METTEAQNIHNAEQKARRDAVIEINDYLNECLKFREFRVNDIIIRLKKKFADMIIIERRCAK